VKRLQKLSVPILIGGATLLAFEIARRIFRLARLFNPTRDPISSWDPDDYGIPRAHTEEVWMESGDGEMLYGWYCRAEHPIASALYCHGNTGNLSNTAHVIPHLLAGGVNVLLFDYRGFGRSSGRPSMHGVVADAVAAARYHETIRPKHLPSILYGYSLGGAIAAQVTRHHSFDGLILQSTFTNLPEITRVAFPRLPLHLFSGQLFDTVGVMRKLNMPLLIIHGREDEVCPCWMANALYDACQSDKRVHLVEGGLHKDLWIRDPDSLVWAVNRFASDLPRNPHLIANPPRIYEQLIDATFRFARKHLRRHPALKAL
jgi:uncharacterized protein